jgi:2',3'-cyclic-nucleotide 2'-phosphodiesterase (5'-nucleotidase family)
MKSLLRFALAATVLLAAGCSTLRLTSGPSRSIRILVTGDIDWRQLPQLATLVTAEKPALTVITGKVLSDGPVTYLLQGEAEARTLELLSSSASSFGPLAVCVTPDFLRLGVKTAGHLIDPIAPSVFFLTANVLDSARSAPLGQPYVRFSVPGVARVAVLGFVTDASSLYLMQARLTIVNPESSALRTIPRLRVNTDLVGTVGAPRGTGADFNLPSGLKPGTACRLDVFVDRLSQVTGARRTELKLAEQTPEPGLLARVQALENWADSVLEDRVNDATTDLDVQALTTVALRNAPRLCRADGALFGNALALKPLAAGTITLERLLASAPLENELVKVRVPGLDLPGLLPANEPGIEWLGVLRQQKLIPGRTYELITTLPYLRNHPRFAAYRPEFVPQCLAQVLAYGLRDRSRQTEQGDSL